MKALDLLEKYNVAVPRYTSYPTVPMWQNEPNSAQKWMEHVQCSFTKNQEISLYIHLPYCESLCTYCGCNKHITKNHLVEIPYIKALLKEWSMYTRCFSSKPVLGEIHLGGGTPTFFKPKNLAYLIRGLLADAEISAQHDFSFEAHPNSTTYEHLKVLKDLGFSRVSIGVQDFDPVIMRTINRVQTETEVEQVTKWARELGYASINYDLIYGLPLQTNKHLAYNLQKVSALKPDRIAFYSYAHVPNVARGQRAYSEHDLPSATDKLNLYLQGKKAFQNLGYLHIGMDHFALANDTLTKSFKKKNLHRNFMGYTTKHTQLCIGLGASAISDSWTAYAQNEKNLKNYLLKVKQEDLPPVSKNHFLTPSDLKIRQQILNLICHFEVNWFNNKKDFNSRLLQKFRALERDGLVKVFPFQIKVTPLGQSFIRNICSKLDLRLQENSSKKPTYSKAV
jgi:oxygen-independent coproporphyrinogen-3 oxidase